ncbi:MAG: hypothetical protein JWM90_1948 [Thermoleophilia bacterium]|nr:hypothetical protein [Thermoleophilia bacterium]
MRWNATTIAAALTLVVITFSGCQSSAGDGDRSTETKPPATKTETNVDLNEDEPADRTPPEAVVGARVRFSHGSDEVIVTIGEDSPATRDFLSMLPLSLDIKEHAGREKISYLPRRLKHEGTPGSDPENGDLIYFVPWGNLGFYYDAEGIHYSEDTLHLGTYSASRDALRRMEGQDVRVAIID